MASVGDISTITLPNGNTYDIRDTNAVPMTGASSSAAGASGLVPVPTSSDTTKFLRGDGTWGDGGMPMVILSYGNSTWSDFINAYNNNVIVYCRASSSSNPASGSQTRMAFMAYVNNATNPTEVEFQYYRSVSSHSATQQGDQVFVYKLTSASKWTVTTREAMARIVAGTNMSSTYSNNVLTINGNYSAMTGASSSAAGATGLVPAPATGDNEKFLRGDGTWAEAGGTVDSDLSASSTNPVQNSAITNALTSIDSRLTQTESNKADKTDTALLTTLSRGRKANSTVGTGSLAFGDDVTASGSYTHAEGNLTSASGAYTHAEGIGSEASSRGSHAEGFGASATAYYAHAEGCGTTAKSKSQHVAGEYNVLDPTGGTSTTGTYAEIVGNGTDHGNRSNARALDWNGNEYLMGDIYVECGANSTGGTKIPSASFTGATSVTDGANGWVPAPLTGEQDKFLKGDGTWKVTQGDAFVKANDLDSIISDKVNAIKGPYTEEDVIHSAMIFNSGAIVEGSYAEFVSPLIPISSGMHGLKVIHSPTTTALGNIDAGNNYNNGFGFFASDGTTIVTRPSLMQDLGNDIYLFEVPVSASYVRFGVRENNADYLSDAIAYFNQWILLPNADNTITDDFFTIAQQKQNIDIDHLFRADGSQVTLVDAVARSMTQVGEIRLFSGTTAPSKWKLCDGSVISREDYEDLFTAIGTTYGGGDGSTTFAIPDFKGRSPVGVGESAATGHTAHTLGQYAGEEKHTLSTAELASHRHQVACGTWDGGHSGIVTFDSSACYYNSWNGTTQSIGATGSNTAHNTMQPYTGINFIIYTGVEETAS